MDPKHLRWASLKVGVVVLIGLIIFVFIVSIVGTEQNIFTSNYKLHLFMPNVRGLVTGGMVTLGGLKVGYVTSMDFVTRDGVNGLDVTLTILSTYERSITTSTQAQVKTIGLLGDKYIDLSIGATTEKSLPENSFIPLRESFDLDEAGPQFKDLLANVNDLVKNLKHVTAAIDKGEGSLGRLLREPVVADQLEHILRSVSAVVNAVEQQKGTLGTLVYDKSMAADLSQAAANMRTITGQIKEGKGTAGKLVMDDKLYTNLASFTARADSLAGKANADSSNVSKVMTDPEFYNRLSGLMKDLNLLLIDLKEHPGRYVHVSVF
jgi:phospholipid/cholesterol/gamma-HCH transport system substrate-binding protein